MLQGCVVLFAIITFMLMACDPRPNESTRYTSAWQTQAKTSDILAVPESMKKTEHNAADQT